MHSNLFEIDFAKDKLIKPICNLFETINLQQKIFDIKYQNNQYLSFIH